MRIAITLAGLVFAGSAQAATYVYDFDERALSLDGIEQSRLDFKIGSHFDLRFTFDGEWLSGDNWLVIPITTYAGSRITFDLIPKKTNALPLPLDVHLEFDPMKSATAYRFTGDSFIAYLDWNAFRCRDYDICVFDDRFATFLHGWGTEARESTYHVSVSPVPLQGSLFSLLLGLGGVAALSNLSRRSSHSGSAQL